MQITVRPHVPAPTAQAHPRGRAAPTPTVAPSADDGADSASGAGAPAPAGPTTTDRPGRPGGSDTPFTHALERGNGRKLGIHRRMPTAEDVAAEQQAAGLSSEVPTAEATSTQAPASDTPVAEAPVVDDPATVVDAPDVPTLDVEAPEGPLPDTFLDAADPVDGLDGVGQEGPGPS